MKGGTPCGPILIFLQTARGELLPVCLEMIAAAQRLAAVSGSALYGLSFGEDVTPEALRGLGLRALYRYPDPLAGYFDAELYGYTAEACIRELQPWAVLFGSTPESKALSAWLNTRLGTGITADCTDLSVTSDGFLLQTRPAFMGDLMASILTSDSLPQMATVRQGMFPPPVSVGSKLPVLLMRKAALHTSRLRMLEQTPLEKPESRLAVAELVLAVGGGVKRQEDLHLYAAAADALGAAFGCSRALVERGWMPHEAQIGMSGAVLNAKVLICLGISGSAQFAAGIRRVRRVLVVNTDPSAPIAAIASAFWACDMAEVAEELIHRISEGS